MNLDITALVFDLDGVLWNSTPYHIEAFRRVLEPIGIEMPAYTAIAGKRTDSAMKEVLLGKGVPVSTGMVAKLTRKKREEFISCVRETPPDLRATISTIHYLVKHYRLGLCSSGSAQSVGFFLDLSGLGNCFRAVVDGDMVKEAKPSPDIYRVTLALLDTSPDNAVAIEDAADGIVSARNAGMRVVGVEGLLPRSKLEALGVSWVIGEISELASILPINN